MNRLQKDIEMHISVGHVVFLMFGGILVKNTKIYACACGYIAHLCARRCFINYKLQLS